MTRLIPEIAFRTVELSDPSYEHEGLRFATVKSPALGRRGDCVIWTPSSLGGKPHEGSTDIRTLLILLHGVYGSAWVWPLKAGVHRTAQRMVASGEIGPLVIATPSDSLRGDGSGYVNYPGCDVERWIVEEVPAIARLAAPQLLPEARVAIAGLSMGGFGALRLGAKYADRFHAISAHSAITELGQMQQFVEEPLERVPHAEPWEEFTALHWLQKRQHTLPPLRFDCGTEDSLLGPNRQLHRELLVAGVPHIFEEFAGGHEWSYWSEHISSTLRHVCGAHLHP